MQHVEVFAVWDLGVQGPLRVSEIEWPLLTLQTPDARAWGGGGIATIRADMSRHRVHAKQRSNGVGTSTEAIGARKQREVVAVKYSGNRGIMLPFWLDSGCGLTGFRIRPVPACGSFSACATLLCVVVCACACVCRVCA